MIYCTIINASYSTSDLESQTETTRVTAITVTMDEGSNVHTVGNPVYTDSENELTMDNNTSQQTQQHTHAIKAHNNDPKNTESEVENPLCIQEHLQRESGLESDDTGIENSRRSPGSNTNKHNKQHGVDVADHGSLAENQFAYGVEAMQAVQGIESSCSQTQYSNANNFELKNAQSSHSSLEGLTQSDAYEMCSSISFPSKAELQSEMCTSNDSVEIETREPNKMQHLDKSNISEFSHEIKDREEVEKPSNSKEKDVMADQKILQLKVTQLSDQLACFSTDSEVSTNRKLAASVQITLPITHDAHLQEASTPPAETACKSSSNSCDIHDYKEIPDYQPNLGVLQMHTGIVPAMTWPQEQPTSIDKDKDKLDVGVAHVLASLHSCLATPREEEMDKTHYAKVEKHSLKGKLYKLYRRKPSAQLKGLQNSSLPSNEEEDISLQSTLETSQQPVLSTQETVSVKQPSVNRFEFKYKLQKPIRRIKGLTSKCRQATDHNDSQKVHPVRSVQVDMVTKSELREGLDISIQKHEILPTKDVRELTSTSSKEYGNNKQKDTFQSSSFAMYRPAKIVSKPVEQNLPLINEIKSMDLPVDHCLSKRNKATSPHCSKHSINNLREIVPVKTRWVTIQRSKSEEKIQENYRICGTDSGQSSKYSNDSPSPELYLSSPMSYGTLPTKMKLMKEELRRQYRHRPPPPKNPLAPPPASNKEAFAITDESEDMCQSDTISAMLTKEELHRWFRHSPPPPNNLLAPPLASNKEDVFAIISPNDESKDVCHDQSDTISVVHVYEEIDVEVFPEKNAEASATTNRLKSKEELRKLYRHRAPPKVPTVSDTKEDILSDVQQTKATTSSEDPCAYHNEHTSSMAHKPHELAPKLDGIIPSETELLHLQSSSGSTEIIPDTIKEDEDKRVEISIQEVDHFIQEDHNVHQPHKSTAESSSSHALPASGNYMPLIPKRKKNKANSDYATLRF